MDPRFSGRYAGPLTSAGAGSVNMHTQRNFSEILLNQPKIRLYLPFSDRFWTKRTSVWFQINRSMVNTITYLRWRWLSEHAHSLVREREKLLMSLWGSFVGAIRRRFGGFCAQNLWTIWCKIQAKVMQIWGHSRRRNNSTKLEPPPHPPLPLPPTPNGGGKNNSTN